MIGIFSLLTKTQTQLIDICTKELGKCGYKDIIANDKFVFAEGTIPIMLVAHLDTVHKTLPEIYFDKNKQVLWSPDGIGGDDRCGVYAILKICETHKPYVLFTTDEEIGRKGAKAFVEQFKNTQLKDYINFMIEIDRRGRNEAVFYQCNNKDFQDYILSFGFTKGIGSFSDISTIAPEFDIAAVNLSAGYHNEHSAAEYIVLDDLFHTIKKVIEILNDTKNHKYYDFQRLVYTSPVRHTYAKKEGAVAWVDFQVPNVIALDYDTLSEDEWFKVYNYAKPTTFAGLKTTLWWDQYYEDNL